MDEETISSPLEENLSKETDDILVELSLSPKTIDSVASPQERDSSSEDVILVNSSPSSDDQNIAETNPDYIPPYQDISPDLNEEANDICSLREDPLQPTEATSSQELVSPRNIPPELPDFQTGKLVWAKLSGFRFWPGLVVDIENDANLPSRLKTPYREGWQLIHFFGTYDYAWVPPKSCIVSWESGNKKNYANKCKSKFFQLALTEAGGFIEKGELPKGFGIIPDMLESDSDSDAPNSGVKKVDTSLGKIATRGSSKRAHSLTSNSSNAVLNIKRMKLPNSNPSSQDAKVEAIQPLGEGKKRCTLIMKRLGLAPPDPYLGRKFPEKVETDSDSKNNC